MTLDALPAATRMRPGGRRPPRAPDLAVIYAVGDLHGRADALRRMIEHIEADLELAPAEAAAHLVFLGDYVDRGPDSREVVSIIVALCERRDLSVHALKGNHEQALLDFLANPKTGPLWVQNGGAATLAAYGVTAPRLRSDSDAWSVTRDLFAAALPAAHLAFLEGLALTWSAGDYLFVHAGVRPGVPLWRQKERDLLWIRGEFLEHRDPCESVVVHGHTPSALPFVGSHRIGLDTAAYATGVLSALRVHGADQTIIQVRADGSGKEGTCSGS